MVGMAAEIKGIIEDQCPLGMVAGRNLHLYRHLTDEFWEKLRR
jgi:hypothetical protein